MDVRFDGRVAVVTGAGSGIGFACAELLAAGGAKVAMVGRDGSKIVKAAQMLAGAGMVVPYQLDITRREEVPGVVERIRAELGEIDVLVQSAGRGFRDEDIFSLECWDQALALNATGSFQMMAQVVRQSMAPRGHGAIVNVASVAGLRGMMPPMSNFGYGAGKAAMVSLTREGAVMLAQYGVRVNAVAPGGVASGGVGVSDRPVKAADDPSLPYVDLIPAGRHSTPREVAGAVCFLASSWAGNITGQVLAVDGGGCVMGF